VFALVLKRVPMLSVAAGLVLFSLLFFIFFVLDTITEVEKEKEKFEADVAQIETFVKSKAKTAIPNQKEIEQAKGLLKGYQDVLKEAQTRVVSMTSLWRKERMTGEDETVSSTIARFSDWYENNYKKTIRARLIDTFGEGHVEVGAEDQPGGAAGAGAPPNAAGSKASCFPFPGPITFHGTPEKEVQMMQDVSRTCVLLEKVMNVMKNARINAEKHEKESAKEQERAETAVLQTFLRFSFELDPALKSIYDEDRLGYGSEGGEQLAVKTAPVYRVRYLDGTQKTPTAKPVYIPNLFCHILQAEFEGKNSFLDRLLKELPMAKDLVLNQDRGMMLDVLNVSMQEPEKGGFSKTCVYKLVIRVLFYDQEFGPKPVAPVPGKSGAPAAKTAAKGKTK